MIYAKIRTIKCPAIPNIYYSGLIAQLTAIVTIAREK